MNAVLQKLDAEPNQLTHKGFCFLKVIINNASINQSINSVNLKSFHGIIERL